MLTTKQEKFIQNIIKGMSQREAYKNSYNTKKMKEETIDSKACLLFKNDKIRARYEELLKRIEDKAIMSAVERQKWLSKVISGEIETTTYMSDRLKALDILNKMDGQYIERHMNIEPPTIEDDV